MMTKQTVGMMLLAGLVLCFAAQPALAFINKETTGGTFLDSLVNKKAPGQEVEGTINVGYVIDPMETPCGPDGADITASMIISLRIEMHNVIYPFSTSESVCFFDAPGQAQAIGNFITGSVIPTIFPYIENPANWALKEIKNIATSDPAFPTSVEFLLADIKIAVVTKPKHRK